MGSRAKTDLHHRPGGGRGEYVPALGLESLTKLYDPVVALTTRESYFKRELVKQAAIPDHAAVLDLGCGTGTLAIRIAQEHPTAVLTGMDGDETMLRRARRKAADAGVGIRFERGLAPHLPYEDGSFDRVVSSLFFHHLQPPQKKATAKAMLRVLRQGGELHVADWGKPSDPLMRLLFYGVQLLDGFATTTDNVRGELPRIFERAGFSEVRTVKSIRTMFGTLSLYSAVKR